jgi:hypothetical protein
MSQVIDALGYLGSVGAGGGLGYGGSLLLKYISDVNFKVRPELANINGFEAFWSNHFIDWLFHFHYAPMEIACITVGAVGIGLAAYKIKSRY